LIITHDMGVVADVADRVVVMRTGQVVEEAPAQQLFDRPKHPYTTALLAAVPRGHGAGGAVPDAARDRPGTVEPALRIDDLVVQYRGRGLRRAARAAPYAVNGVSLQVESGSTLGLVGESGSGKSTIGKCVLGLAPITGGTISVGGVDLTAARAVELRRLRSRIGVVFQNPVSSLNPRYTIGESIGEPLLVHRGLRGAKLKARVDELLDSVELPTGWAVRYPHELSGGQRQRVSIARAISMEPELLIADEPTSALDVSVQATVLELLSELQHRLEFACLFISHDLAVVDQICDRVAVLSNGQVVELGDRDRVLNDPQDGYTRRLLESAPVPDPAEQARRRELRYAAAANS
jgi:peptide/nickel transport system ATP-binding protein